MQPCRMFEGRTIRSARDHTSQSGEVARYYDDNTARFLRFGQGGRELAIHRAVWGPGVADSTSAHHYINEIIAQKILATLPRAMRLDKNPQPNQSDLIEKGSGELSGPVVLDIGCGVGGTLLYLAEKIPGLSGLGLTLSSRQAGIAEALIAHRSLGNRIAVKVGDVCRPESYQGTSLDARRADIAYAVESLLHVADTDSVFRILSQRLAPGGLFIVCDDLLTDAGSGETADTDTRMGNGKTKLRLLAEFKTGWHAYGLRAGTGLVSIAQSHGFEELESQSLTSYLELGRPRDRVISCIVPFLRLFGAKRPWAMNMLGGNALQALLRRGLLDYRLHVFRLIKGIGAQS